MAAKKRTSKRWSIDTITDDVSSSMRQSIWRSGEEQTGAHGPSKATAVAAGPEKKVPAVYLGNSPMVETSFIPTLGNAICDALYQGLLDDLLKLIKKASNIDALHRTGQSPLMRAAQWNYPECIFLLFDAGAAIDQQNRSRRTAATMAALEGNEACLRALIERGADLSKARHP